MKEFSLPHFYFSLIVFLSMSQAIVHAQSKSQSTEALAARADVIAIGKVAKVQSAWNENRSRISTQVTLAVEEFVKGTATGSTVTLEVPGGEVDGVGELYTHMPTFKQDEEVIVFAERDRQNRLHVSGGSQGKVTVNRDASTGFGVVSGNESKESFVIRVKKMAGSKNNH